jgi:hypothetical protein
MCRSWTWSVWLTPWVETLCGFDSRRLHLTVSSSSVIFRKRRQFWRRLCVSKTGSPIKRGSKLVELDLVRIELRRVDPRMTHQALERTDVASTLAHEAVREAMPKLVGSDVCAAQGIRKR